MLETCKPELARVRVYEEDYSRALEKEMSDPANAPPSPPEAPAPTSVAWSQSL
jgi:hypothetical protein